MSKVSLFTRCLIKKKKRDFTNLFSGTLEFLFHSSFQLLSDFLGLLEVALKKYKVILRNKPQYDSVWELIDIEESYLIVLSTKVYCALQCNFNYFKSG